MTPIIRLGDRISEDLKDENGLSLAGFRGTLPFVDSAVDAQPGLSAEVA
jgi:hypothetical protein